MFLRFRRVTLGFVTHLCRSVSWILEALRMFDSADRQIEMYEKAHIY